MRRPATLKWRSAVARFFGRGNHSKPLWQNQPDAQRAHSGPDAPPAGTISSGGDAGAGAVPGRSAGAKSSLSSWWPQHAIAPDPRSAHTRAEPLASMTASSTPGTRHGRRVKVARAGAQLPA